MHKYNSNDGIEYESEDDGIEKEGYKYNEDKCNNKDNDDDDSDDDDDDDDDDWKIECIECIEKLNVLMW